MELAVIGGGASGLMAAAEAARRNGELHVSLYDAGPAPGTKILATGNGHCNFTNYNMFPEFFCSNDPSFVEVPLKTFGVWDTVSRFASIGVPAKEKNGYVYPVSEQAATVREALVRDLERLGVKIHSSSKVIQIQRNDTGTFTLELASGYRRTVDTVLLACGSKAMPSSGCDGHGYRMAEALGHRIIPVIPALTGLICSDDYCSALHGIRVKGAVTLRAEGMEPRTETGEIQLTKYGVSGIPIFQLCRHAGRLLEQGLNPIITLDTMTEEEESNFLHMFESLRVTAPDMTMWQLLHGFLPDRLVSVYLKNCHISNGTTLYECEDERIPVLMHMIHQLPFHVVEICDIRQAQACAGGIDVSEVDPSTMGSRLIPGLFFAGEILDVDGMCGGYNLQWAWTSGVIAGNAAADYSSKILQCEQIPIAHSAIEQLPQQEKNSGDTSSEQRKNNRRKLQTDVSRKNNRDGKSSGKKQKNQKDNDSQSKDRHSNSKVYHSRRNGKTR